MIKEAYVSFEVAKLLKEKGFDCLCTAYYINSEQNGEERFLMDKPEDFNHYKDYPWLVSSPTQQMAMAWLREDKEIIIIIDVCTATDLFWYTIHARKNNKVIVSENDNDYSSYEEAVEAALLYVLKNLI